MANSDKLAEVVAALVERDEDFRPFELAAVHVADEDDELWPLSKLKHLLGYGPHESIQKAVNRAKVAASKVGWSIKEHFRDGSLFDDPDELYLSKYAALLVTVNADPGKTSVSVAQAYFALHADRQRLEDEKRLKSRLDVATENRKLSGIAQDRGVRNFQRFNGVGLAALYGGMTQDQVKRKKGLPTKALVLDYAGSEELAANLFRITQTTAALRRQTVRSEDLACRTHQTVATGVRAAIVAAGNNPPEQLPAADRKIDLVATAVKRNLIGPTQKRRSS